MRRFLLLSVMCFSLTPIFAQRVDFNLEGRAPKQVTANGFIPWAIRQGQKETMVVDREKNITFTVQPESDGRLGCVWWKDGVQRHDKLVGDALGSHQGIILTISGLSAGDHTLLAYHNSVSGGEAPAIDVFVDGVKRLENVKQTSKALRATDAGQSYITFQVKKGKDVVIVYRPQSQTARQGIFSSNICINALVLDESNPKLRAQNPIPADLDLHANADNGKMLLKWDAAQNAVKHHVFAGTDRDNLQQVQVVNDNYYWMDQLNSKQAYYWRVDEEDAQGKVTEGETWCFRPRHLAFPTAEGYGKYAIGGRGGTVYHVTNLNDDNQPGSLRYGLENLRGPRTIVFDVGGTIYLKRGLGLRENVTLAGQTAPGEGILLRGASFGVGHDAICRYIRHRLGGGRTSDGMGCAGGENTIIDHCSIAWSIDEGFSSRGAKTISFQHNIIAEALNVAGHKNYPKGTRHGYAATIGGDISSYHHNLLAHNEGRNWSMSGALDGSGYYAGRLDLFNNVCYNWGGRACDGGAHEVNFVNNYYKEGPATHNKFLFSLDLEGTGKGTQSAYVSGNVREEYPSGKQVDDKEGDTYRYYVPSGKVINWEVYGDNPDKAPASQQVRGQRPRRLQKVDWQPLVDRPFFPSLAKIETARETWKNVMSDVGCNMPSLDIHDQRIIQETLDGTYSAVGSNSGLKGLIDDEKDCGGDAANPVREAHRPQGFDTDGDGLPNWWEALKGSNPQSAAGDFSDANADADGDGFTSLEDYLDWMTHPHGYLKAGEEITVDMKRYFAGYNKNPMFVIMDNGGMTCKDQGNEKYLIKAPRTNGFYAIRVFATDDDRVSTLTREILFAVTPQAGELK